MVNEYYPQYVAIEDAVADTMGTIGEDQVGAQVNRTGDFVKSIVDTLDYKLEDISLAQTHAQAESSNTSAYAGAAFGVIGLAATLALVSTCNKKAAQQNQEALLWTSSVLNSPMKDWWKNLMFESLIIFRVLDKQV